MSRNGIGTYSLPSGNPFVTGTTISSTTVNTTLSDIATALTTSLASDGQTVPTANLPMGSFKHTGAADATSAGQYLVYGQTSNASLGGNLTFSGTGIRILGDFSNATIANRALFQTSTTNGNTSVGFVPNGTATTAVVKACGASDPTNAPSISIAQIGTTESRLSAESNGSSAYAPMTFYTGGSERLRIDTSGRITTAANSATDTGAASAKLALASSNIGGPIASGTTDANVNYRFVHSSVALDSGVYPGGSVWWQARSLYNYAINYDINFQQNGGNTLHVGPNGGLGYGAGSGGTVTQATSRTTAVTLNKPSGDITLFTAAGSATPATFRVSNTLAASTDVPTISVRSASNKYVAIVTDVIASTGFDITFWSASGTASDTPIFHFNLGKGANA